MSRYAKFAFAAIFLLAGCGKHLNSMVPVEDRSLSTSVHTSIAAPSFSYKEYPIPTLASHPQGIAVGSDGNLWFVESSGNNIGRITPAGAVTEFPIPTANSEPVDITPGQPGYLWFTEYAGNKLGRISTSGTITEYTIPTASSHPFGVVQGPDDAPWFTESAANKVGTLRSGGIVEFTVPGANVSPLGITVATYGDNLMFAESSGSGIGTITTSGKITQLNTGFTSRFVTTIPGEDLFWTDAKNNAVGIYGFNGNPEEFPLTSGSSPSFSTAGPYGMPWWTDFSSSDLRYFDLNTNAPSAPIQVTASSEPDGITSLKGSLWFTEYNANKIGEVHPAPTPTPFGGSGLLYTDAGSSGSGPVLIYKLGNVNPSRYILSPPVGLIAVSQRGYIYGVGSDAEGNPLIDVFAPDAKGRAKPVRQIAGSNTQLNGFQISSLAPDGNDDLFVAVFNPNCNENCGTTILVFGPNANGNVAPARILTYLRDHSIGKNETGVTIAPDGTLYAAAYITNPERDPALYAFRAGAGGPTAPSRIIAGSNTLLDCDSGYGQALFGWDRFVRRRLCLRSKQHR